MKAAPENEAEKPAFTEYDYSNFYYGAGDDPLNLLVPFNSWYREARPNGYYLYMEALSSAPTTHVRVRDGKTGEMRDLLNMASYNYLGISYRPEVKQAAHEALERYGLGASGSPILSGTFDIHEEFAAELARFKDKEDCLLFPTGYSANVGFISSLMRAGDTVFLDQYSHASIVDGAILAKAKTVFFRHNNPLDLERKLSGVKGKKLVVVEGVYSMDGDVCALPEILEVTKRHGARMLIDEAHSTFLFGPNGRGVAEHFGLDQEVDFHLGTFSKSLGGQGGFVCGTKSLVSYSNAFARSRFFSCNLSPVLTAGLLAGLRIAKQEPDLRANLWSNVAFLRRRFAEEGIDIGKSTSQVMPVMVNNDSKVFAVAEKIQRRGLFLNPVTYPAVPKHKSRLRISVSAAHTEEDLETAVQTIASVLREEGDLPLTRYGYRNAINGFFEFPSENARRILPRGIEPVEVHHGTSVFAVTVFDFHESEVGEYGEVVYAVLVPPFVREDGKLAKGAFFPWQVATTTRAAREHAIGRWHLPHWMDDVEVELVPGEGRLTARVKAEGTAAMDITITEHSWNPVSHLYQSFQQDEGGRYLANIVFEGEQSEHEEETGRITLHEHAFNKDIVISEVYEEPFREMWMREGIQLFDPLQHLPS